MSSELILSLGSNIEPKRNYLIKAIIELNKVFTFNNISSLYLTKALDDINQDKFLNLTASYFSEIKDPYEILKIIKNIEKKIGRKKDKDRQKGPRIIDIDIIFFGDIEICSEELNIPHKSLFNRKFVLEPLIEMLSKNSIYLTKYSLEGHLNIVKKQNTKKLEKLKFG